MDILYITANQTHLWTSQQFNNQIITSNYQDVTDEQINRSTIAVIERAIPNCEDFISQKRFSELKAFFFICEQATFQPLTKLQLHGQYTDYLFAPVNDQQFTHRLEQWQNQQCLWREQQLQSVQLETLLDNIPYMAWFKNTESEYIKANHTFQTHCGKSMPKIYGNSDEYVWDGAIGAKCREYDLQVMTQRQQVVFEEVIPGQLGRRHFNVYKAPVIDTNNEVIGTIGIAKDITDRLNQQSRGKLLIENLPFAVCLRDLEGRITEMNANYQRYVPTAIKVGDSIYEHLVIPSGIDRSKIQMQDQEVVQTQQSQVYQTTIMIAGEEVTIECHKAPIFDVEGNVNGIIVLMRDISELVAQEKAIQKLAYEDSLTGLYNRSGFYHYLQNHYQIDKEGVVIFVDLDNFKQVNDRAGHAVGNVILQTCAKRLQQFFPDGCIARDGGDEFTILLPCETQCNQKNLLQQVQLLLVELSNAIIHQQKTYQISVSIGVVIGKISHETIDEIILQGETALQEAKQGGKHRVVLYTPFLDTKRQLHRQFIIDFQAAMQANEIELFYQPQYTCSSELIGFEALFRWQTPKYQHLNVLEMITMIEATPAVQEMGSYVMRQAMQFAKKINTHSSRQLTVSINVSAHQIMAPFFVQTVEMILAETDVEPTLIDLEITETVLLENIEENIAKLAKLRELGLKVSLDDFGTGYSSLNYLVKLPLSQVKIDRSFICEITKSEEYQTLVKMIIEAAHSLNLPVVAEGVETSEEIDLLAAWQADYLQGYYFSKPIPQYQALKKIIEKQGE